MGRVWVLLMLWSACGGELVAPVDAGKASAFDGDAVDASSPVLDTPDAAPDPCLTPPTAGSSCEGWAGRACEYGGELSPTCNLLFECRSDACGPLIWHQIGQRKCPVTPPPGCPASYPGSSDAGACATTAPLSCWYAEGRCQCVKGILTCNDAPQSCPKARPRLGTACPLTQPEDVCPFQLDGFQTDWECVTYGYICASGVWSPAGCPPVGAPPPC